MSPVEFSQKLEQWVTRVSHIFAWSSLALVLSILLQILLKLFFQVGSIALEELQWHFSAIMIMMGLCYADLKNSHVRVDIWHSRLSARTQKRIEIGGILFLVFPFLFFMLLHAMPFWWDSFIRSESSLSPGGLPYRWIIKSFLPFGLVLLFFSNLARLIRLCSEDIP